MCVEGMKGKIVALQLNLLLLNIFLNFITIYTLIKEDKD